LLWKNLGVFYDHLAYFMAIGNILWPFGKFCSNLVYFSPLWNIGPKFFWQPCNIAFYTISKNASLAA
jgi:hypothetical protein